jgi:hypothetical protein
LGRRINIQDRKHRISLRQVADHSTYRERLLPNQRRDDYDLVFQCALLLLIQVYHGEFIAACQTAFANRLEIRDRAAGMRRASGHVKSQIYLRFRDGVRTRAVSAFFMMKCEWVTKGKAGPKAPRKSAWVEPGQRPIVPARYFSSLLQKHLFYPSTIDSSISLCSGLFVLRLLPMGISDP